MFRLSVVTDEVSQDLETAAEFAERFNLHGVEIRNVWGKPPQHLLPESDKIRRILSKHELRVSAIASPFFKADLGNPEECTRHLEILKSCIALAKKLETDIIRGFTFWRNGSLEDHMDEILEKYRKPLDIIEAEGIVLGVENEPSTYVGNGRELDRFLKRTRSKNVKAIWDPGNDVMDPSGEIPFPDGYGYVRGRIAHVHVKDGVRKGEEGEHQFAAFGEGEVDYRGQLAALKRDGYTGYLSLETHWRLEKQLSRDAIIKPGGEEFSSLGLESSEICMKNLQALLREIS